MPISSHNNQSYVSETEEDGTVDDECSPPSQGTAHVASTTQSYIAYSACVYACDNVRGGSEDIFQLHSRALDGAHCGAVMYKETMTPAELKEWIGSSDYTRLQEQWALNGYKGRTTVRVSPQIGSDGRDLRIFQVGTRELQTVSYYPDWKVWAGRTVVHQPDGSVQRPHEYDITDSWMWSQCDQEFPPWDSEWLEKTKRECEVHFQSCGKYLYRPVPIASAHPMRTRSQSTPSPCPSSIPPPECKYQQGSKGICAYASLASALHFSGFTKLALAMFCFAEHWFDSGQRLATNQGKLSAYMEPINRHPTLKRLQAYWFVKKADTSLLHSLSSSFSPSPRFETLEADTLYWVVLEYNNGGRNHSVAILGGWVFDSNVNYAYPCTRAGLDEACKLGGGYRRICQCIIFSPVARGAESLAKKRMCRSTESGYPDHCQKPKSRRCG